MTIILKKGKRLSEILPPNSDNNGSKKLDAKKFVGKIKFVGDPLEIQKKMRDEWD
ncbi:MAG: hypothetical protein LCH67_18550 [Bacteroidetes bacterium]|jgi:hypothetical protein|nr:hypothetical protein [Bacteroidota bacterium]